MFGWYNNSPGSNQSNDDEGWDSYRPEQTEDWIHWWHVTCVQLNAGHILLIYPAFDFYFKHYTLNHILHRFYNNNNITRFNKPWFIADGKWSTNMPAKISLNPNGWKQGYDDYDNFFVWNTANSRNFEVVFVGFITNTWERDMESLS